MLGTFGAFRDPSRDNPEADNEDFQREDDDLPFGRKWDDDTPDYWLEDDYWGD